MGAVPRDLFMSMAQEIIGFKALPQHLNFTAREAFFAQQGGGHLLVMTNAFTDINGIF